KTGSWRPAGRDGRLGCWCLVHGVVVVGENLRVAKKKAAAVQEKIRIVQPAFHRVTAALGSLKSFNAAVVEDPQGAVPALESAAVVLDALGGVLEQLPKALTLTMGSLEGFRGRLVADGEGGAAEVVASAADEVRKACALLEQALAPLDRAYAQVDSLREAG